MDTFPFVIRTIVLAGAVFFALGLLGFGFYVVVREYNMVTTWPKMREFLKATSEAGLEADVAKGAFSLGRTRPGIIMMAIGAILLGVCVVQPFSYEHSTSTEGETGDPETPPAAARPNQTSQAQPDGAGGSSTGQVFSGISRDALRDITINNNFGLPGTAAAAPVTVSSVAPPRCTRNRGDSGLVRNAPSPVRLVNNTAPRATSSTAKREVPAARSVTVADLDLLQRSLLDRWLANAAGIRSKSPPEIIAYLQEKAGPSGLSHTRYFSDKSASWEEIAALVYGDSKYVPLLQAFNPDTATVNGKVPAFTPLAVYQPLHGVIEKWRQSTMTRIRVAGKSKQQFYDELGEMIDAVVRGESFQENPKKWWEDRARGDYSVFARSLSTQFEGSWGSRRT